MASFLVCRLQQSVHFRKAGVFWGHQPLSCANSCGMNGLGSGFKPRFAPSSPNHGSLSCCCCQQFVSDFEGQIVKCYAFLACCAWSANRAITRFRAIVQSSNHWNGSVTVTNLGVCCVLNFRRQAPCCTAVGFGPWKVPNVFFSLRLSWISSDTCIDFVSHVVTSTSCGAECVCK